MIILRFELKIETNSLAYQFSASIFIFHDVNTFNDVNTSKC